MMDGEWLLQGDGDVDIDTVVAVYLKRRQGVGDGRSCRLILTSRGENRTDRSREYDHSPNKTS